MGFVPLENCFVAAIKRNILTKTSVISMIAVGHWASFGRSLAEGDAQQPQARCLLWLREPVGGRGSEPKPCARRLLQIACNFYRGLRVGRHS